MLSTPLECKTSQLNRGQATPKEIASTEVGETKSGGRAADSKTPLSYYWVHGHSSFRTYASDLGVIGGIGTSRFLGFNLHKPRLEKLGIFRDVSETLCDLEDIHLMIIWMSVGLGTHPSVSWSVGATRFLRLTLTQANQM